MKNNFPDDFVFGVATSSYQIEGGAYIDGRKPSIWDDFATTPGKVKNGDTGEVACDHYHLFKDDINLIKEMNLSAYRFSIAWPRVLSNTKGTINPKGLDFYDRLIDTMLEQGIDPYVTLYHWDLPMFWQEKGGWLNRDTAYGFRDYAGIMANKFGDRVSHWITHNEMWCSSFLAYQYGYFAPGERDLQKALTVAHHILLSHGLAVDSIRSEGPSDIKVGIAPNYLPAYPCSDSPEDIKAAKTYDGYFNRWFLDPLVGRGYPKDMEEIYKDILPKVESGDMDIIAQDIDFIGVNYYNSNWYRHTEGNPPFHFEKHQPPGLWKTVERDVYPQGLYDALDRFDKDYGFKELYITENGAACYDSVETGEDGKEFVNDPKRIRFFKEHFAEAEKAVQDGIPLKGFFLWSLMDNFEWAEGYSLRYGLYYVDFKTQKRIAKNSALWVKKFLG